MTGRLPQIFLGDFVRAAKRLGADDEETLLAVARLLGLREDAQARDGPGAGEQAGQGVEVRPPPDDDDDDDGGAKEEVKDRQPEAEGGKSLESALKLIFSHAQERGSVSDLLQLPDWLRLSGSLRASAPAAASAPSATSGEPVPEPLLVPRWVRGILTALLSTRSADGLLDTERVVEALARGELLTELPRLPELTTRHGVQLLLDVGEGMAPFGRDQSWMAREVVRAIGAGAAGVLRFAGTPLRGAGPGPRRTWGAYSPPPTGTPVMLLTDLGIARAGATAAGAEEWLEFAGLLRRAGCPAVALVPYRPARWPAALARALAVVEWDRPTTVATARRLVGRGLEVRR